MLSQEQQSVPLSIFRGAVVEPRIATAVVSSFPVLLQDMQVRTMSTSPAREKNPKIIGDIADLASGYSYIS